MNGRRRIGASAVLLACGLSLPAAASEVCARLPEAKDVLSGGGYELSYRTEPEAIRLNAPFALLLAVCGPEGPFAGRIYIDADMPAHRHGMNYQPTFYQLGCGRYRAAILALHMRGDWRFRFTLHGADGPVLLDAPFRP